MSDLLGIWPLSPVTSTAPVPTVRERLGPAALHAMWAQLPGLQGDLGATEHAGYILCADGGRLHRSGDHAVAAEGFVAPGGPSLDEFLAAGFLATGAPLDPKTLPRGHFVLARVAVGARSTLHLVRSLSGGERLYYTRVADLLLFASSLRPLLAHPAVSRAIAPSPAAESILVGHPLSGAATAVAGIDEVLPGHVLEVRGGEDGADARILAQRPLWQLACPQGDPDQLARRFRAELEHSVAMAVGDHRPIAVALSGGIDSSAVAAAAVEVVGADNVVALTYEFDDPTHSRETHHAHAVCQRLGIRHDVFAISLDDFLAAIPENIWRNENPVHWPKSFLIPVTRAIRARGFDRYLTGFGIGSHMAYLGELARVLWPRFLSSRFLSSLPRRILPGLWRRARFEYTFWPTRLDRLHPGFETPHIRLYHLLLAYLQALGHIADVPSFYPRAIRPLVRAAATDLDLPDLGDDHAEAHASALRRLAFSHLISCIDITRSEKSSRELGVYRISPAHMSNTIPYAYFPVEPPLHGPDRRKRPGKHLLQLAYRGVLPDEILFREKSWADAVASPAWLGAGRRRMLETLSRFPHDLAWLGEGGVQAIRDWEPRSILASSLAFALWQRIAVDTPPSPSPPTWETLAPAHRDRGA